MHFKKGQWNILKIEKCLTMTEFQHHLTNLSITSY